jgi:hypothetical protein
MNKYTKKHLIKLLNAEIKDHKKGIIMCERLVLRQYYIQAVKRYNRYIAFAEKCKKELMESID